MGLTGTDLDKVTRVLSHKQGLAQSADWLDKNLASAERVEATSTAAAAQEVDDGNDATVVAIAAPGAADFYDLEVLQQNVSQSNANKTRFYVLSKQRLEGKGMTRAVFVATCEANQIDDIIVGLHDAGLEIVSLHDRPEGSALGSYHYLIEVETEADAAEAQIEVACAMDGVRFAGCFNTVEKE
jgi:prephenate dehydratase